MPQKQRSPREAGNGHKLAGWVRRNSTMLEALLLAAMLLGLLAWQGGGR